MSMALGVLNSRRISIRPRGTGWQLIAGWEAVPRIHDARVRGKQPLPVEPKLLVRRLATDVAVLPEKEATHALPGRRGLDEQKYLGRIGKVGKNGRVIVLIQVQSGAGMAAPIADHAQALEVGVCAQSPLQKYPVLLRKRVGWPTAVLRLYGLKILDDGGRPVLRSKPPQQ